MLCWRCVVFRELRGLNRCHKIPRWNLNIYSEYRIDTIVKLEFKVSCKAQIRKAEVKCRHRPAAAAITSPFSPALLCWPGRYVGSQHQFATVTQPNGSEHWRPPLKWIRSITVCRGEEPSMHSLMHQRWGLWWVQHIQATPLHENYIDIIITWSCRLKYDQLCKRRVVWYFSVV